MAVRLLLYITSHLSARHLQYMQRKWPTHVDRALFSHDVLFYAPDRAPPAFRALFTGNFTEVVAANPGYQSGAIAAVSYVQTHRERIEPYDWVLRFNPDVMIRDADWLFAAMHDASVDGIFVDCRQSGCTQRCTKALIQTDLLAFRPRSLCSTVLAADNAERRRDGAVGGNGPGGPGSLAAAHAARWSKVQGRARATLCTTTDTLTATYRRAERSRSGF